MEDWEDDACRNGLESSSVAEVAEVTKDDVPQNEEDALLADVLSDDGGLHNSTVPSTILKEVL